MYSETAQELQSEEQVEASVTLDPADWGSFRSQAHAMLDDMIDYTANIRKRLVWQPIPDETRARFRGPLPTLPTGLGAVHAEFMQHVLPYTIGNVHPGFMGWVHGGGNPVGMLAEMLAAGLNANLGGRDHGPIEVERQVTEWMRQLFGFPQGATGLFVTGTSMANLIAVVVARDVALGFDARQRGVGDKARRLTGYASTAVHGSVGKAMDIAGIGMDALRKVATDGRGRIDVNALQQRMKQDRRDGLTPFMVVGTAGTVDTGAIDGLDALADLCQRENIWLHVDGALGALAMLAPDLAPRLLGMERADSIAFDFHKWGQVPYDAGFVLVRDGRLHQRTFDSAAAYLRRETRGMAAGSPWPCDFGPDLSRGFHALKVWFTLKVYGANALGATISRTCELARYLEERIAKTPELELLAPVELNIVCFRYRSQLADRINKQIVLDLQECGSVAPSATTIDGRLAIRAAIVNHRTSRADIDTLVEQTLVFGRALESAATQRTIAHQLPAVHERTMLRLALASVEKRLRLEPGPAELLFQQASLTENTGRIADAQKLYLELLEREPAHVGALNNLGNLLLAAKDRPQARRFFELAVLHHPLHLPSRANLGNVLIKSGEHAAACEHFKAALRIDPGYRPGHAGLSFVLGELGDPERAAFHRRRAFADRCVVVAAYRGEQLPITVLELVSTTGGNVRTDDFLSSRVFQRILVTTEFYDPCIKLPPHHFVFNAVGEADGAAAALAGAAAVMEHTTAPVINAPSAVLATGRYEIAQRLSSISGVVTARTLLMPRERLLKADAGVNLTSEGFQFPVLLRTPGFHGGDHFLRVDAPDELAVVAETLPGNELFVIQYLDARSPDRKTRKYRVMFVDGQLYPLHVAISDNWKIHYFSADMAGSPEHRAEDAAFLADMAGVLGPRAMAALEGIQKALALDYGGIDFSLNDRGEVLLFEANATMAIVVPDQDSRWDYRRPAVERIYRAVWEMLRSRARLSEAAA